MTQWISRSVIVAWLLPILAMVICADQAFAHAKLLRTQPEANATLKQAPQKVELWFSEELQPQFNTITVTDQSGKRVDKNNVSLADGSKKLQIDLEDLGSGTYTVAWKNLSADQHALKGQFTFTVALSGTSTPTASVAQTTQQTQASPPASPTETVQESGGTFSLSVVRWLEYLTMMTLFGGLVFQLLMIGPSLRRARGLESEDRAVVLKRSTHSFTRLSWLSIASLTLAILAALIVQTAAVLDVGFGRALSPSNLYQVLSGSGFGGPWLLQFAMLVLVAAIVFIFTRTSRAWLLWAGIMVMAVMFIALSITGHAGAAAKEWRSALISDWVHLVTAAIWVGGLFHLALNLMPAVSGLAAPKRVRVFHEVIPLFTRYAIPSTVLITLTGVYNSWIHLDHFAALWNTTYGKTVLLKILIFIPMLVLGGTNTFVIHPRARRLTQSNDGARDPDHLKLDRSFRRSVGIEAALGVAVLLAAAVLVFLTPAREHPGMSNASMPDSMTDR